jgi:serine/threonine protein kinase
VTPPAGTAQDPNPLETEEIPTPGLPDPNRTECPGSSGDYEEPQDALNLGLRKVGPYRIQSMLGRGGMGVVTLALTPDGRSVALKLLPPECLDELGRQRFTREQEALRRVEHRHVVALEGAGFDESTGQPYIAMEWVQGISLHDVLERLGKLSPAESIFLLKAVAEGLAAAHAEGVIHRDLKPSNVIVTPDGGVKLIDFGLALSEDVTQRLTRRGYVVGTRSFIPPEVLEQDQPWTDAADCFALGVLGSYFLGGHEDLIVAELNQTPYEDPYEVVPQVDSLPGPEELRSLIGELRERDPAKRPDAAAAAARLGAIEPTPAEVAQLLSLVADFTQSELDGLLSKTAVPVRAGAPSRPSRRLEVGHEFDGYRVEAEISRGSMGAVFKGHHDALDRSVAIKVLLAGDLASAEERERFLREAESSGALDHPNVVKVLDAGEARGAQFMIMELVTGGSLRERIPKGQGLPPEEALGLFEGICAGVNHAHMRGVIHRDLKPENVMISEDGRPQVTDFGLAKRVEDGSKGDHLTVDGALMGTAAYMAPEQARGQMRSLDVRADVYALGVMFYELLCGQLPFQGNFAQLIDRKLRADPKPLRKIASGVPWELEAICLRAMEREPGRRYPTVQSLIEDLERYRAGLPVQARSAGLLYRARKWVGRHLWGVSLALALLTAAGGALANTIWTMRERERLEGERLQQEAREAEAAEAQKRREAEAKVEAEAKRVAAHEQRVRDAVGSAWEAAAVGSYTLAAERFQVASELVGGEPVAMNLDELPVPNRLRQDLGVTGPEFVTPSLLREWSRGTRDASAAAEASRLLSSGRTLRAEAQAAYRSGADPVAVRKLYFKAIDELRGSLRQVPDFKDALHEQQGLSREFAAVLVDLGYPELAEFVLLIGGADNKLDTAQQALPRDPVLHVVEADKVTARHRFGGRVFFRPTQAFAALRAELARRAPNLGCTLRIRTEIAGDGGRILRLGIKAVEVQVGDRVAGTVRPLVVVPCEDEASVRPVSLDTRGFRVVAPLEQTRDFNLKRLVAAVRQAVLKEAQLIR